MQFHYTNKGLLNTKLLFHFFALCMATILITGGTGLVGSALTRALVAAGDDVIILTRGVKKQQERGVGFATWDPLTGKIDEASIMKADHVVHLAGANVAEKRWTAARKKEIIDSRVESGKLLARAINAIANPVKSVVSASAIGYYGPDPAAADPRPFVEDDPPANDFLGTTSRNWEEAIASVTESGKRLVILRTGIVLSNYGGAYPEFKKTLPFRLASIIGNGNQIVSWIHIDDLVGLYMRAIKDGGWQGAYNAVAPVLVTNKQLTLAIARSAKKVFIPVHVPSIVLKTLLGEMSVEVLKSTTVSSEKAQAGGYQFKFNTIEEAVKNLEPR